MVHRSHSSPGIAGRSSQESEIFFGNRDLKLAHLPTRSRHALAALPSISPIPSARFTDFEMKIQKGEKREPKALYPCYPRSWRYRSQEQEGVTAARRPYLFGTREPLPSSR